MTREEAIAELKADKELYETDICHANDGSPDGRLLEALDMAIKSLSAETPTDQQKHQLSEETPTNAPTDIISRADAIESIASRDETDGTVIKFCGYDVINILKSLSTADRPHGEWIDWLGKGNEWECSVCKCSIESHGSIAYNFCPNCGAVMSLRGEEDE